MKNKDTRDAWPVECMASHGAEGRNLTYHSEDWIGNRKYTYYKDDHGSFWFTVSIATDQGILPEEEAIFGKRKKKKAGIVVPAGP